MFPPAAPKGLAAVATPAPCNLIWDANTETDLAGYIVLRGEAPGDTLQPLTPAPIRETIYKDTTVSRVSATSTRSSRSTRPRRPIASARQSERVEAIAR